MSGQMKNYKNYIESLDNMKEPVVPKAKLDMRGAIRYAQEKGVSVEMLTKEEKERFIQYL
ncbi:MAG: hypothetical protein J5696_06310 [Lachnospiraceae bacterium]|nr:hypothetical protein [Lachnospiraceae bacterium]